MEEKPKINKLPETVEVNKANSIANTFYDYYGAIKKLEKEHNLKIVKQLEIKDLLPKLDYEDITLEDLKPYIKEVLQYKFQKYVDFLSQDPDSIPLIANLANMYAKVIDYNFYDAKDALLYYIAKNDDRAWSYGDGIVYVETDEGQVSFHVFEGQDEIANKYGLDPEGRDWTGEDIQFLAEDLLYEYIKKHFSNYEKEQKLEEIEELFKSNPKLKSLKMNYLKNFEDPVENEQYN